MTKFYATNCTYNFFIKTYIRLNRNRIL